MPKPTIPPSILKCWDFMGLYHDGWTISGKPYRVPWSTDPAAMANFDPLNTEWELYNINEDPIQQVNVADKYPEKVKELEKLFWEEAENTMSILSAAPWAACCSRNPIRSGPPKGTGN
jgi:arylsulfatase A-like enzyme